MSLADDKVMVSVCLERKHLEQIDAWAAKLGHSRSKMSAIIMGCAVEDDWVLPFLCSRFGMPIVEFTRWWDAQRAAVKEAEATAGLLPAA